MSSPLSRQVGLALKRVVDVGVAAVALLVLLPALLVIAAAIRLTSPGGALFRQARAGKAGREFVIMKFRTMDVATFRPPGSGLLYADDPRITRVGRVLRRTGLDELPQLLNVLRGEMSLVGPRPDLPHHAEQYTPEQRIRLEMRPGITGWAQVAGRNDIPWEQRIALDVEYVRGWSLWLDARVIVRTIRVVLAGRGGDPDVPMGSPR